MARRSGENTGLPSFFQNNPWLGILAQRGAEPTPDFVASRASSAPVVSRATGAVFLWASRSWSPHTQLSRFLTSNLNLTITKDFTIAKTRKAHDQTVKRLCEILNLGNEGFTILTRSH